MPHPAGKKEESRAKILASAGRGFRANGFGGLGVDGIAKAAGVTSGAFYAHFASKAEAFRDSVRTGMRDLADGIAAMRDAGGDWAARFVDFYASDRLDCDLAEACALQSLTNDVARAEPATRADYTTELKEVVALLAQGTGAASIPDRARAIALLALLSGGVSMARAVDDADLRAEIASALRQAGRAMLG